MPDSSQRPRAISQLIANTSAAQPLDKALHAIAQRKARLLAGGSPSRPAPEEPAFSEPEPMPLVDDPDAFAAGFWQRLKDKHNPKTDTRPPSGSKPHLVVDNDQPPPQTK